MLDLIDNKHDNIVYVTNVPGLNVYLIKGYGGRDTYTIAASHGYTGSEAEFNILMSELEGSAAEAKYYAASVQNSVMQSDTNNFIDSNTFLESVNFESNVAVIRAR